MSDTSGLITNTDVAVSPWNVPVNHGRPRNPIVLEKRLKLAKLHTVCGSFALASLIIATDSEVREIFSVQEMATYKVMKSFVFLVVVNGILASYSLVQVARCARKMRYQMLQRSEDEVQMVDNYLKQARMEMLNSAS